MRSYVLNFPEIDKTMQADVGGKGANLGELTRIPEILVPEGFCITTTAYKRFIENNKHLQNLLDELAEIGIEESERIAKISQRIRSEIKAQRCWMRLCHIRKVAKFDSHQALPCVPAQLLRIS